MWVHSLSVDKIIFNIHILGKEKEMKTVFNFHFEHLINITMKTERLQR